MLSEGKRVGTTVLCVRFLTGDNAGQLEASKRLIGDAEYGKCELPLRPWIVAEALPAAKAAALGVRPASFDRDLDKFSDIKRLEPGDPFPRHRQ